MRVVIAVLLLCQLVFGITRRVPQDYPTITTALDAVQDDDTVLVASGTYAESLTAPPHRFVLMGVVDSDTSISQRPVVDPSPLDNPALRACLVISSGSAVTISHMTLRNGRRMHIGRQDGVVGGLENFSQDTRLEHVLFDSTFIGCRSLARIELNNCDFVENRLTCFFGMRFRAVTCNFHGQRAYALVYATYPADSSQLIGCSFSGNQGSGSGVALHISGAGWQVLGCTFTDFGPSVFSGIEAYAERGCVIRGCEFSHSAPGTAMVEVHVVCEQDSFDRILIEQNHIFDNQPGVTGGSPGIFLRCSEYFETGFVGVARENRLERNVAGAFSLTNAIQTTTACSLLANVIQGQLPRHKPNIYHSIDSLRGPILRFNSFEAEANAVQTAEAQIDARLNWWGDSTGPNAPGNPNGQGARVGLGVLYVPWLTDTTENVDDAPQHLPTSFNLSAFPNPFNSAITIEFVATKAEHLRLEIFDLTGRHVATIADEDFSMGIHRRMWNAEQQASGIYFARLSSAGSEQRAWLEKLVLLR